MLHTVLHGFLNLCMYVFIVLCIASLVRGGYVLYADGFSWDAAAVYAKSFLIFLVLSIFSYKTIPTLF